MDIQTNRIQELTATDQLAIAGGEASEKALAVIAGVAFVAGLTTSFGFVGLVAVAGGVLVYVG